MWVKELKFYVKKKDSIGQNLTIRLFWTENIIPKLKGANAARTTQESNFKNWKMLLYLKYQAGKGCNCVIL